MHLLFRTEVFLLLFSAINSCLHQNEQVAMQCSKSIFISAGDTIKPFQQTELFNEIFLNINT